MTCQSNSTKRRGHNRLPKRNRKYGGVFRAIRLLAV